MRAFHVDNEIVSSFDPRDGVELMKRMQLLFPKTYESLSIEKIEKGSIPENKAVADIMEDAIPLIAAMFEKFDMKKGRSGLSSLLLMLQMCAVECYIAKETSDLEVGKHKNLVLVPEVPDGVSAETIEKIKAVLGTHAYFMGVCHAINRGVLSAFESAVKEAFPLKFEQPN